MYRCFLSRSPVTPCTSIEWDSLLRGTACILTPVSPSRGPKSPKRAAHTAAISEPRSAGALVVLVCARVHQHHERTSAARLVVLACASTSRWTNTGLCLSNTYSCFAAWQVLKLIFDLWSHQPVLGYMS